MTDTIRVIKVSRSWRIFINDGLVTRETHGRLKARGFLTAEDAWTFLSSIQQSHYTRTGQRLGWNIKGEKL